MPGSAGRDCARAVLVLLLAAAVVAACANDATGPDDDGPVLPPKEHTDETAAVTQTVGSSGGTIEVTAADGIRYSLRIPAHAVAAPVDITLTPIDSIEAFPIRSGAAAGVLLEPDGLAFLLPAELTIIADGVRPNVGFTMSHEVRLIPARVTGDTTRLTIMHFSSAGTADATAEELNVLAQIPAKEPSAEALQEVAAAVAGIDGAVDSDRIVSALRSWLSDAVLPDLAGATGDPLDAAIAEYMSWLTAVEMWAFGLLDGEKDKAMSAVASALREEIDRLNAECAMQNDLGPIEEIKRWVGRAEQTSIALHDPSLSLQAVAGELCAQPVIIEVELPDTLEGSATLEVQAGLSIGGRAPVFDPAVDVSVSSPAAIISPRNGVVDGSGWFSATVDLMPGSTRARIDVVASYPGLPVAEARRTLTAEGRIRIGLRVDDELDTVVEPGDVVNVVPWLTQGRGGMMGRSVLLELIGPGTLSSNSAVVENADNGDAETVTYTAPDENATVQLVGSFRDGTFMVADTATITVGGCAATPPDFEYWGPAGVFVDAQEDDGGGTVTSSVIAAEPAHLSYEAQIEADESGIWISAGASMYVDDYLMVEALAPYTGDLTLHMDILVRGEFTAEDPQVEVSISAGNDRGGVWIDLEGREDDPPSIVHDVRRSVLLDNDIVRVEGDWIRMRHYANASVRTRGGNRTGSVSVESRMDILDNATDSAGASIPIRVCSAMGASY